MPDFCFLCGHEKVKPLFSKKHMKILMCHGCGIAFQENFAEDPLKQYQGVDYYDAWWKDRGAEEEMVRRVKERTADWVFSQIRSVLRPNARILEVGCAFGYFLDAAKRRGYRAVGLEISEAGEEAKRAGFEVFREPLENLNLEADSFDAVVLLDVLEHLADPEAVLKKIKYLLNKKKGVIVIITPNIGSFFRKILRSKWLHFKSEHLYYYSRIGLTRLLAKYGFQVVCLKKAMKGTSLSYMSSCSEKYKNLPSFINRWMRHIPGSRSPFSVPSDLFCVAKLTA